MTRMGPDGLPPCKCGCDRWEGNCFPGRSGRGFDDYTIFTCEMCGHQVKVREDEVDE